jgi:hypothetical protein
MIDGNAMGGALFMAACLVVAGIFAVLGGLCWLAYFLWCHVDIRWIP